MARTLATLAPLILCLASCTRSRPPFVLLVTVDTLRADHLGALGGPAGITPHLDRLAADSTLFLRAYSPASFTLPAVAALMTSRYPEGVGVIGNSTPLSPGARTLAQWLAEHGFRTAAVVSNYVLRRTRGMDAGFQSYDATFPPARGGPPRTGAHRAGYRGEVAYVDQAVGALLDGFATRGLFERTIVVFAADHGEELGEAATTSLTART